MVEVRQGTLGVDGRGRGPAGTTGQGPLEDERKEERREGEGRRERRKEKEGEGRRRRRRQLT